MVLGREVDEAEARFRRQGRYLFQLSIAGHDAVQTVCARLLKPGHDWFFPYYRDRTFALGVGMSPEDIFRQGLGKAQDPSSGGRQMPNHFGSPALHIVSQSSPTGTQYLQAVGVAEAGQLAKELSNSPLIPDFAADEVVYVSSGEGATSEGEFYEALSAASLKQLPVLFVVQDNEYAISVPVEEQTPGASISRAFRGFPGLLVEEVDGLDVLDCYERIGRAVAHCRAGKGPALVHAKVVRLKAHSDSDDDSLYRTPQEKADAGACDPMVAFEASMIEEGIITEAQAAEAHSRMRQELEEAFDAVAVEPEPGGDTHELYVYNPETVTVEESRPESDGAALTMIAAVNHTLEIEMARDPRIVVFGEDVADCSRADYLDELKGKGGVFKATHNLQRIFGSGRVFNTALAEASIVGRAVGMSVRGFRPVVEIQFFDYIWTAMMQIRNELATMRWRSSNAFSCPVVIRVPIGGFVRGGAMYHSQSGEAMFCHIPGLRVVMPSNARDVCGLLRASIRCGDPVLFLEHKHLYRQRYSRSADPGSDYVIPLGKAVTVRQGRDVTVVTYGAMVQKSLEVAEELEAEGLDPEIIDLRTLQPYDWDAIVTSVKKTGRLVTIYEETRSFGFGAEIVARAADELFEHLDAPVARVAATDAYVGYAPEIAERALPNPERIEKAIRDTIRY
jgi:2-oxoisovalerate dehydrogenase E1 component